MNVLYIDIRHCSYARSILPAHLSDSLTSLTPLSSLAVLESTYSLSVACQESDYLSKQCDTINFRSTSVATDLRALPRCIFYLKRDRLSAFAANMQVSVQVCVFVFDILMVDGEALIKHSLRERRSRIGQALPNMRPGYIQIAQSLELKVPNTEGQDVVIKVLIDQSSARI